MIIRRRDIIPRGMGYAMENCSPLDVACVGRNSAASAAENQQILIDSKLAEATRCRDKAKLSESRFQPGLLAVCDQIEAEARAYTPAAAVQQDYTSYWNTTAYGGAPDLVDASAWNKYTASAPAPVVVTAPVLPAKTPAVVINSSGGQNAPMTLDAAAVIAKANSATGLSFPWYVWAGGAAAVIFFMRGGGR